MNLLEIYIKEVHNVEPCTEDWTREFPDREFVEVDVTTQCYGSAKRSKHIWNTREWEQIKKQGYYIG